MKLTGDLDELGIDGHLFCDAVHLEFDVIVAVEDLGVFFGGGEGFFVAPFEQKLADFTREARRRADQAFGASAEDIFVDAGGNGSLRKKPDVTSLERLR